ncbi:MAG TPA: OsmC family protein [Gemmatimonadales bacterium]|nr:OsmC family protein [Gemmatimonadales bacterium]
MSNLRTAHLEWTGTGMRFRGAGTDPVTPAIEIDGDGATGPSPTLLLLLSAAACSASDVVLILTKGRVALSKVAVDVQGTRRETDPRRFVKVHYRFTIAGGNLDRARAERAVRLSVEKYCSVMHTLAPDLDVAYDIALE